MKKKSFFNYLNTLNILNLLKGTTMLSLPIFLIYLFEKKSFKIINLLLNNLIGN